MDDLGPIEIEFIINNPEVTAAAGQVEATLQGVTENTAAEVQKASDIIVNAQNNQFKAIERLKIELAQYKISSDLALNPEQLIKYNQLIEQTSNEIVRLSNAGKIGFDGFGNKIPKATEEVKELGEQTEVVVEKQGKFATTLSRVFDIQNVGSRIVTQFTRGLIGMATGFLSAEIGAKAIEAIIKEVEKLNAEAEKLDQAKQNLLALNEVMAQADKEAGKQIETLTTLYDAATNVKLSMDKRIEAANELRAADASTFANATALTIANGELKNSFDELSQSILKDAESQAAASKVAAIYGQIADIEFQKQKVRNAHSNEDARYRAQYQRNVDQGDPDAQNILDSHLNLDKQEADRAFAQLNASEGVLKNTASFLQGYVANISTQSKALDDANALLGSNLQNFNNLLAKAADLKDYENIKNALEIKLKSLTPSDAQFAQIQADIKKVEDLEKKYQVKPDNPNAQNQALKERIALLNEIATTVAMVDAKGLSSDQKALTDISNRYNALYQKIDAFNNDPKNKNAQISGSVVSGLQASEQADISNQADLNENKYIQQDIETKKKLYADYEAYRSKVGSTIADNEYADLLRSGKDFQAYLTNVANSIDKANNSPAMQQRQDFINKEFIGLTEEQKKQLQALLSEYATYQDKREAIIQVGADNEAELRKKGNAKEADQVKIDTQQKLTILDEGQFKQLNSYKNLYENINLLSTAEAKKQIEGLQALAYGLLSAGKLTPEAFKKIFDTLNTSLDALNKKGPEELQAVGNALKGLASDAGTFDDELGKVINTAGTVVSSIGTIEAALNALNDTKAVHTLLGDLTSVIGIVAAGVTIVTSIVGLFSHAAEKAAQLKYENELQLKAIQAINTELQRQLDLIDQIYGPAKIAAYQKQLNDITAAQAKDNAELVGRLSFTGDKVLDDAITKYNEGQKLTTTQQLILNDVIKKYGDELGLAGKSLTDLEKLMDNGKLDEATAAIVQSLIDLQQQAIETQNALNETLTGSTYDDLVSGFNDLFANAKTSVQDFADYFQKEIQTAILKSFETQYVDKQMQQFYNDLAADIQKDGGTLTAADIAALRAEFNKDAADAQAGLANIEKATGITVTDPNAATGSNSTSPNTLAGQISGITADQANILEGSIHGMQLAVVESNDILTAGNATMQSMYGEMKSQTIVQMQIAANTKRTADNTDAMVSSLENIDSNTSSANLTNVLRAAGK